MDRSIILELLPLPDVVSDGIMVAELYRIANDTNNDKNGIEAGDLFIVSLIFFVLSVIVTVFRFGWKLYMKIKGRNDLECSPHYRQTLRLTFFLQTLLEDLPIFLVTLIYINRQLFSDPEKSITFAQEFSLIASIVTLGVCGLTQEYLNNCTKRTVKDSVRLPRFMPDSCWDACTHIELALRGIPYAMAYWVFFMLPAAITTLVSNEIISKYPGTKIFAWVVIGLWVPSTLYICCREDSYLRRRLFQRP